MVETHGAAQSNAKEHIGAIAGAAAFVSLAGAMVSGNGRFTYLAIALALAAFVGLIVLASRTPRAGSTIAAASADLDHHDVARAWETALAVALLLCLALGLATKPGESVRVPAYRVVLALVSLGLMVAVGRTFMRRKPDDAACRMVFFVAIAAGFGLRLAMLKVSPSPAVDVYVEFQESARHLLAGLNPYTTPVSDVYQGTRNYGYQLLGYAYLPANLFLQTAGYALAGDFRYACVASEVLVVLGLYQVAWRGQGGRAPMLLVLLFLFHPRGLLVVEQGWTEPFIAGAFALFLWWRSVRPLSAWPGAAYGYMLSLKQYLVYFALHLFIVERRSKAIAIAAATGLVTLVPFLAWSPASLFEYGVKFQLQTAFRPDGLTVVALFYRLFGFTAGKWLSAVVGLVVASYTYWRFQAAGLRGYMLAVTLTTFAIFLAGSQAFCNYYYLVSVFCLFVFATQQSGYACRSVADE